MAARPSERQGRCLLPVAPHSAYANIFERTRCVPPTTPAGRRRSPSVIPTEAEGSVPKPAPSRSEGHPHPILSSRTKRRDPFTNKRLRPAKAVLCCRAGIAPLSPPPLHPSRIVRRRGHPRSIRAPQSSWWEPNTFSTTHAASNGWKRRTMRPILGNPRSPPATQEHIHPIAMLISGGEPRHPPHERPPVVRAGVRRGSGTTKARTILSIRPAATHRNTPPATLPARYLYERTVSRCAVWRGGDRTGTGSLLSQRVRSGAGDCLRSGCLAWRSGTPANTPLTSV